jgi:lipoprotein-anchoring transpeptidase ErfK/SrfK
MFGFDYYVPEVPYAMFFHEAYAVHGTYWHDLFGQPVSRGCVNLRIGDAKKLFEWAGPELPPGQSQVTASYANPGTVVVVHE